MLAIFAASSPRLVKNLAACQDRSVRNETRLHSSSICLTADLENTFVKRYSGIYYCAVALSLCLAFVGCDGNWMGISAEKQASLVLPAPAAKLVVEGFNGSIEIVGTDTVADVEVEATIRASGRDQTEAEARLEAADLASKQEGDTLTLFVERPSDFKGAVSYRIQLPANIAVLADTSNGEVTVRGTQAPVRVSSSNGSVAVSGASEQIAVKTSNASIRVDNSSPIEVDLVTSNGGVTVATALAGSNNRIVTSNAQVQAELAGAPVSVSYQTSNASVTVDSSKRDRAGKAELGGTLETAGGDAVALSIQTSNGSITLSHTASEE